MAIQYLYGDSKPVLVPIASAQAVAVGDLVAQAAGTLVRATDIAWGTLVATASAPTVTDGGTSLGTAFPLTNSATGVKVSYNTPWGEGPLSSAGSATPTAHAALIVTAVALPANVLSINYYVETSAGSGVYKLYGVNDGSTFPIFAYGIGQAPPSTPAVTGALQVTQYAFAQAFLGVSAQAKGTPTVPLNFFDNTKPYGNSLPVCRVDTAGFFFADLASAQSYNVGQLLGPDKDTGNDLLNQQVVAVASAALAVCEVIEAGTSLTRYKVKLLSTLGQ